jgi:dCMP deaminase
MSKKVPPRMVPDRDEFYMGMAFWYASRSKDPKTQVGACIVSATNKPLGFGYNGPPAAIKDSDISWGRPEKNDFMDHAEENACEYSTGQLEGATIYVTAKPCKSCMKLIVRKKFARVVYFPSKFDPDSSLCDPVLSAKSDEIARLGGVRVEEYRGALNWMRDRMDWMAEIGVFG